jgi:hypothetical protein
MLASPCLALRRAIAVSFCYNFFHYSRWKWTIAVTLACLTRTSSVLQWNLASPLFVMRRTWTKEGTESVCPWMSKWRQNKHSLYVYELSLSILFCCSQPTIYWNTSVGSNKGFTCTLRRFVCVFLLVVFWEGWGDRVCGADYARSF